MINIDDTNLIISGHFGSENFTGVVGIMPRDRTCKNPLLLSYIDSRLTGRFLPHNRTLRSLSIQADLKPEKRTTLLGEEINIVHDAGSLSFLEGEYLVDYYPQHDLYYAAAQYGGSCGGCRFDGCSKVWSISQSSRSISDLYLRQTDLPTALEIFKSISSGSDTETRSSGSTNRSLPNNVIVENDVEIAWVPYYKKENEPQPVGLGDCGIKDPSINDDEIELLDVTQLEFH